MTRPTHAQRLSTYVLDGVGAGAASDTEALADELTAWLRSSRRFRAWFEQRRDKIRKKLRAGGDPEGRRDVRAELAVARRLLSDPHIELDWETAGSQRGGPDFRVTYRQAQQLNLEVTRARRLPDEAAIISTVLVKLRQLPPSIANALIIVVEVHDAASIPVQAAIRAVRARADTRDEAFFASVRGPRGGRAMTEQMPRLGGIYAWSEMSPPARRATLWVNPAARIALPPRAARSVLAALDAPTE